MKHHVGIASISGNSQSLGAKILFYVYFGNVAGSEISSTIAQLCEFMHSLDENHVNELSEDNNLCQQLIFIGSFNILVIVNEYRLLCISFSVYSFILCFCFFTNSTKLTLH